MNYCHDCSEFALRFDLRKTSLNISFVSEPQKQRFEVINLNNDKSVTVSVKDMTVTINESVISCKDWKILLKSLEAGLC